MNDSPTDKPVSPARVLVVDEDEREAGFLKGLLQAVPYDVSVFKDGAEALLFIEGNNPPVDAVLLNMATPAPDVLMIVKRIKAHFGANSFMPVILLSSSHGPDEKSAGLALADEFIVKPFDADELRARIGVMMRIRKLIRDMAPDVKHEHEQKIARTQLYRSARLASIGTFASGVAHELNNPLTAVLGFSGALLERINRGESIDRDELEQYLTIINSETVRCSEIVENLSQFAREGEVQIRSFALLECVKGAVKLVNPVAIKKQVTISLEMSSDVRVRADIRKLQQAIVFIITNSLDFCKKGSRVTIDAFPGERFVKLCISDNGPGIEPDMLSKVFDPFFSTKEVGQGMGMGLAMCHVIMEECNGGIDVISEINKGTTVILDIPADSDEGA